LQTPFSLYHYVHNSETATNGCTQMSKAYLYTNDLHSGSFT
jgi:hypothetical protein